MKQKKDLLFYLAFFAFIIFLNTPYGLSTRVFLTKGTTAITSAVFPPKESDNREALVSNNLALKAIYNASDLTLQAQEGKVVFINHWATWCPPCRAEMPSLDKLYTDYSDRVEFLFITDEPKPVIEKYFKAKGFHFPTYNAISRVPDQINTSSLPATFILDKKGNIVLEEFGPADWNSPAVREVLDKLLGE